MLHTLLSMTGPGGAIDLGDYATRGLTMDLTPIPQAVIQRRDLNGALRDVSVEEFQKHRATITCSDQMSPGLFALRPGTEVTVTCIPQLGIRTMNSEEIDDQLEFTMLVGQWTESRQEAPAATTWTLPLEEV